MTLILKHNTIAKPFLKWAGGKTQLISTIEKTLPAEIRHNKFTYIEPFVGGGSVLFWIIEKYPNIEKAVINDINTDLINTYQTIASNSQTLISVLKELEKEYYSLNLLDTKKSEYYYSKRNLFNLRTSSKTDQAALFIFLNRTCFNGLYRVNKNNLFNVPIGSYKNPTICDEKNIVAVSEVLKKVEIINSDFESTIKYASDNTFFYFDPPYKPLDSTSSFNSYAKDEFNDSEQIRLSVFCEKLNNLGHKWMLSNSDLKGKNPENQFFDTIYKNYNIARVKAKRIINANPTKRGELNELLITNYQYESSLSAA